MGDFVKVSWPSYKMYLLRKDLTFFPKLSCKWESFDCLPFWYKHFFIGELYCLVLSQFLQCTYIFLTHSFVSFAGGFLWGFYDFERDSHNYYLCALFSTNDPIMQLLHFLIIIELTTYNDQEVHYVNLAWPHLGKHSQQNAGFKIGPVWVDKNFKVHIP